MCDWAVIQSHLRGKSLGRPSTRERVVDQRAKPHLLQLQRLEIKADPKVGEHEGLMARGARRQQVVCLDVTVSDVVGMKESA